MIDKVRGKFRVTRITQHSSYPEARVIELGAVYKDPASEENTMYSKATPTGKIEMQVDNPVAAEFFQLNRCVYVDFTPAEL